jgi:hypothetical protein
LKRLQRCPAIHRTDDDRLIVRMEAYLVRAQFDEGDGFAPQDAAYGGWGFDAAKQLGVSGHMDLAHTRRAMQALRAVVGGNQSECFTRAELFLRVVQRHPSALAVPTRAKRDLHHVQALCFDGGFFFSPIVESANKGRFSETFEGQAAPHFRSYATATCDGVLALLAAGVPPEDERVRRAADWIRKHDDLSYPEGVPTDHPDPWGEAIRYYHYAVRGEAYAALDWPGDWKSRLAAEVARHQAADGSFRNDASPLMKEDDPLLCTALAAIALTHCQIGISANVTGEEAAAR